MFSLRALLSTALSPVRASAGTRPVLRANLSSTPARSAAFGALWQKTRPACGAVHLHGHRGRAPQGLVRLPLPSLLFRRAQKLRRDGPPLLRVHEATRVVRLPLFPLPPSSFLLCGARLTKDGNAAAAAARRTTSPPRARNPGPTKSDSLILAKSWCDSERERLS
ncbi:hypothetical protein DFH09DRAFT_1329369 [Mycena vulgaris]|nr:hypothetical protein DFH09DRAFT_1329369 [Mycena vulgaris]